MSLSMKSIRIKAEELKKELTKKSGFLYVAYYVISEEYPEIITQLSNLLNIRIDIIRQGTYLTITETYFYDIIANYDVLEHLKKPLLALSYGLYLQRGSE